MTAHWVFLHGFTNTPRVWTPIIQSMAITARSLSPEYPATADIDAIGRLVWDECPDNAVLVGHSFGGYVALAMLAQRPAAVAGIALVNSHAGADTEAARAIREQSAQAADAGKYSQLVEAVTKRVYHPDNLSNDHLMRHREAEAIGYGAARFAAHQRACARRPDREAVLRQFTGAKFVVTSEIDLVIDPAEQRSLAQRCDAAFHSIGGAGHMLPAEQPQRLAAQLTAWGCAL
jgi:pimeloyl-ACP methyl ester carboxylesterase